MKSIYSKAAQEKQHLRAVFTAPQDDDYIEFDDSDLSDDSACPDCSGDGFVIDDATGNYVGCQSCRNSSIQHHLLWCG